MKSIVGFVAAMMLLSFAACKKSSNEVNTSVIGYWKLTEELNDPGDGSGVFRPTTNTSTYIRFNADSTFQSNVGNIASYNKYSMNADNIRFYSNTTGSNITFRFVFDDRRIDIFMNCIEACAMRFKKSD